MNFSKLGLGCIVFISVFLLFGCVQPTNSSSDNSLGTSQHALASSGNGTGGGDFPEQIPVNSPAPQDNVVPSDSTAPADVIAYIESVFANPNSTLPEMLKAVELAQKLGIEDSKMWDIVKARTEKELERISNDPQSSLKDVFDAVEIAQLLGLPDEKFSKEARARAELWIEEKLTNPDSSIAEIGAAGALAQMLGINPEKYTQDTIDRLRQRIEEELSDSKLCKKRLDELLPACRQLDFTDLAEKIEERMKTAGNLCSRIIIKNESSSPEVAVKTHFTSEIHGGILKKLGNTSQYYFTDGELEWHYDFQQEESCYTSSGVGNGTQKLKSAYDGYLTLNSDGTYSGTFGISNQAKIAYTEKIKPSPPEYPQQCDDYKAQTYEDTIGFDLAYIEGKWSNPGHLTGSITVKPEDFKESDSLPINGKTIWDIELEN